MDEVISLIGVMSAVVGVPMLFIFAVPPLAKAFARRIEGPAQDHDTAAELESLRAEVDALRDMTPRLLELEERVDFAERLLAQQSEPGLLAHRNRDET